MPAWVDKSVQSWNGQSTLPPVVGFTFPSTILISVTKSSLQVNQNMGEEASGYLELTQTQHLPKAEQLPHPWLCPVLGGIWRMWWPISYLFGLSQYTWEEDRVYDPKWTLMWKLSPRNVKWWVQSSALHNVPDQSPVLSFCFLSTPLPPHFLQGSRNHELSVWAMMGQKGNSLDMAILHFKGCFSTTPFILVLSNRQPNLLEVPTLIFPHLGGSNQAKKIIRWILLLFQWP